MTDLSPHVITEGLRTEDLVPALQYDEAGGAVMGGIGPVGEREPKTQVASEGSGEEAAK